MTVHDIIPLSPEGKGPALTMSSREIAELTGKEHKHVMRDIRVMLTELHGEGGVSKFGHTMTNEQNGQEYPVFWLPKRETWVLMSGYSITLRARVIDRWQEMEAQSGVDIRALMSDPAALGKLFLQFADREATLQGQIEEMRPQVQALDRIALSDGSFCITDAAKTLQVRPKDLFLFLRSHRWIFSRQGMAGEVAYQDKLANGLLEHKTTTVTRSDGSEKTVTQVRVTPKGMTRLAKEFPPIVKPV
jgi:phage antirepressor YoqD-like protein